MSIQRFEPGPYLSTAAVHGGVAYLAGLTPDDLSQNIAKQTSDALANVDRALKLVGSNKSLLLRSEVWIADMSNFDAMNDVYQAWLDPMSVPPRVCTEARLWDARCQVEFMMTAIVSSSTSDPDE